MHFQFLFLGFFQSSRQYILEIIISLKIFDAQQIGHDKVALANIVKSVLDIIKTD